MNDLTRRALLRAVAAFTTVFVVGTLAVFAVGRVTGGEPGAAASSSTPSSPSEPAGPVTPEAWLAWVPGGLPDGFGPSLTTVPLVATSTTATADIAWLTQSLDADGVVVDRPTDPYMIPIDVTGVEPTYASFVPQPERRLVEDLQPGEGILSESEAALRGIGEGAILTFRTPDGATSDIAVVGTLPDVLMGGYELLVTRGTGEDIGVTHERYALFQVRPNAHPDPVELGGQFEPLLPIDAPYPQVEVRAPGEAKYLRANDRELPPVLLKRKFTEFTALPDPADPTALQIDPQWIQDHIASQTLPVLGTVTCHTKALYLLKQAMRQLTADGQAGLITDVGDCFAPVSSVDDPEGPFTARDFGAAISLNPQENQAGEPPTQDPALVKLMYRWGFLWGGKDAYPQGALFRYRRPPTPPA